MKNFYFITYRLAYFPFFCAAHNFQHTTHTPKKGEKKTQKRKKLKSRELFKKKINTDENEYQTLFFLYFWENYVTENICIFRLVKHTKAPQLKIKQKLNDCKMFHHPDFSLLIIIM